MLVKVRENIFLSDKNTTVKELKENAITAFLIVGSVSVDSSKDMLAFVVKLYTDKINKPHVKDIACHIVKYMVQNGESIVVIDETGTKQAAFVVSRAICELESKSIYDVLMEIKELIPNFDIGKAYL